MPLNTFYTAYRDTGIKTASGGTLVIMLYDEAVRQLTSAVQKFNAEGKVAPGDIEKFGAALIKTQEIINELQTSLDMDKGGQIAQNLMSLYVYFNRELMDANINKDKSKLEFVLNMLNKEDLKVALKSLLPEAAGIFMCFYGPAFSGRSAFL